MKLMGHAEPVEHLGPRVESKTFGIKSTNKAFEILSSKLYKDKIRAIIREVSCNAYDSHVAAGKADEPFTIFLPSSFDPYFKVRDYGIGLSEEEVTTIFTTFFESTKEDSNDFIGALGLGSKSPFSYVDSFTVITYHSGKRMVFECFKDEGIPKIVKRSEVASNEPVGVEIIIPTKPEDIYNFATRAKDVFRWFSPQPIIENAQSFAHYPIETFGASGWNPHHDGYYHSYNQHGKIIAVMGQVAYEIDPSMVGETELRSVVIQFPLGDLDVQAGREELSYDKTTIVNIQSRLGVIKTEIRGQYSRLFSRCKNIFAAEVAFQNIQNKQPLFKCLEPTYRGNVLSGNPVRKLLQKHGQVEYFNARVKHDVATGKKKQAVLKDFVIFLEVRKDKKDKVRLSRWHRENPEKFGYSITLRGVADDPVMLEDLKGLTIVSSAEITIPREIAKLRSAVNARDPRIAFEHEVSSDDEVGYILTRSLNWVNPLDPMKEPLTEDVAISFHTLMKTENLLTGKSSFIPWTRKSIISDNWTNIYDSLNDRYLELKKDSKFVNRIHDGHAWMVLESRVNRLWFNNLHHADELPSSELTTIIKRIRDCRAAFEEMKHWINYENTIRVKRTPRYDLAQDWSAAKTKFPLFFRMIQPENQGRYSNEVIKDEIVFREMAVYIRAKILEETV